MSDPLLKLIDINKKYNITGFKIPALDEVSLEIYQGDRIFLYGQNGSGKSSLINVINGLVKPDSGKIILNGKNITDQSSYRRAEKIATINQKIEKGTFSHLTVEENIILAKNRTRGRKFIRRKPALSNKIVKSLPWLNNRLNQKVLSLSGGERQGLAILMGIIENSEILLLDEFTQALDFRVSEALIKLVHKIIIQNNMTTIIVTHNLEVGLRMGTRIIIQHSGKIIDDEPITKYINKNDVKRLAFYG